MPGTRMTRLFKKLKTWQSQGKLRQLARWEQIRAKGKARFVLRGAVLYSLIMIPARDFSDYLVDGKMQPWSESFWTHAVGSCLTGMAIGLVSWWSMEGRYKNALLDRRIALAEIDPSIDKEKQSAAIRRP